MSTFAEKLLTYLYNLEAAGKQEYYDRRGAEELRELAVIPVSILILDTPSSQSPVSMLSLFPRHSGQSRPIRDQYPGHVITLNQ